MNLEQVRSIINDVTLPDGKQIRSANHPEGRMFIQIYQDTICNRTGKPYRDGGRKWDISGFATVSEVVFTVWKALLTFEEHELREQFLYKGKCILDPHISVEALLEICEKREVRNEIN